MLKKVLIVLGVLILVFAGAWAMLSIKISTELEKLGSITDIDLTSIEDGNYEGFASAGIISAKVLVTVENHQITKIDLLEHVYGTGKPAEAVLDMVVQSQTLIVDAVAGSTGSSKILLKSIENALMGK